jgi:hypothetical protein
MKSLRIPASLNATQSAKGKIGFARAASVAHGGHNP